jgi:hypothetical protein
MTGTPPLAERSECAGRDSPVDILDSMKLDVLLIRFSTSCPA